MTVRSNSHGLDRHLTVAHQTCEEQADASCNVFVLRPELGLADLRERKYVRTIGILLYIIPIYAAGITQGLMWRAFDASGRLAFPDFVETVMKLMPFYWVRALGGTLYLTGAVLMAINFVLTVRAARARSAAIAPASAPASL